MAHAQQDRYASLVMAKLRQELVLKDGIVFNTSFEGDPKAGMVKVPKRSTEATAGDYNKASGGSATVGTTEYVNITINKDKYVNEIIDGYDAAAVPDDLIADRLDSAGYSLAKVVDYDGSQELLTNGKKLGLTSLEASTIYDKVVDIRTAMSKDNVPNDGRRYLLVTPDAYALMLKDTTNFIRQGDLSQRIKETGAIGQYAGFNLYEWNDDTSGLIGIAGHPDFAARVAEFIVAPKVVDLDGSAAYIGASAVKGRMAYGHKVLEDKGVRACYYPASIVATAEAAASGKNTITVTSDNPTGHSAYKYRLNPAKRATFEQATATGFSALTSGNDYTVTKGDLIEVVSTDSGGKVLAVGYAVAVEPTS